ncbi:glycoside hydrolase family 3 C-terminal domain-containing protein [Actinotignum schaalii]|uniref:glycoside hydrolase family 3 C-terminal domain-containing protein n=1 Tax=Actinomycetaceae TaxID=2049 RepID=UPI00237EDEE7|nr:glycoside hydrolase family 3 C-terminal domain-containing protein [Actinotignum schaalii]MDE1654816.1 glycoside hydrolase family 3 C-terminal domain-containing protein [Actinotignum schaalii]
MTEKPQQTQQASVLLTGGKDFWHTHENEHGHSIMVSDGPHGLRVQPGEGDHLGSGASLPATCFPPAVALGSTWNPEAARAVGTAIAEEARAQGVGVVLGPGINIKRDPRCGRNFEYFSEDPFLTASMATAYVTGVQSRGVGTSLKHFAANNQETDRMRRDSQVDERTLREIYLRAFEKVVKEAAPWTIMCSYNSLNGTLVSENRWLLTTVLREEWGYNGVVVSDWGAVRDRRAALRAGLDLEMPAHRIHEQETLAALEAGELEPSAVETAAARVSALIEKAPRERGEDFDAAAHHDLARKVAEQSVVLLKNDGALPLRADAAIAVFGEFAQHPRYQGAGSSLVNPTRVTTAWDAIQTLAPQATYAPLDESQLEQARGADVCLAFIGLGEAEESEGYDRGTIRIPAAQLQFLDRLLEVNPNVVVVLTNGSAVTLPFADKVPAILETWVLGQAGGEAIANIIFGKANPSGKLTETIPLRLEDCPSYPHFPGDRSGVRYGEGLFVGYRGFDARVLDVVFPFGHGLSYTTFEYSNLEVEAVSDDIRVSFTVRNTGQVAGREVAQVYVSVPNSKVVRVPRELKGFAGVELEPGEARAVSITVSAADLAYWSVEHGTFLVEKGTYRISVGASSRDLPLVADVELAGNEPQVHLTLLSTVNETLAVPGGRAVIEEFVRGSFDSGDLGVDMLALMGDAPLSAIAGFRGADPAELEARLAELNGGGDNCGNDGATAPTSN